MLFEQLVQFDFLQNAFLSGILIGFICPMIGVFLVVRRLALFADTLAHVTLSGVAAGMLFNVNPVLTGMLFSVSGALLVERLRNVYRHYQEIALPIILSSGTGLSVVLISLADGFNRDLFGYLFGSLIAVSRGDLLVITFVGMIVVTVILLLYKELLFISFEEEAATISGVPKKMVNIVFIILVALVIGVSMNIVGVLLVSALMTLPVASALQIARSFKQVFVYSILFAQISVIAGLIISFYLDVATGGTIVVLAAILLTCTIVMKKMMQSAS